MKSFKLNQNYLKSNKKSLLLRQKNLQVKKFKLKKKPPK